MCRLRAGLRPCATYLDHDAVSCCSDGEWRDLCDAGLLLTSHLRARVPAFKLSTVLWNVQLSTPRQSPRAPQTPRSSPHARAGRRAETFWQEKASPTERPLFNVRRAALNAAGLALRSAENKS